MKKQFKNNLFMSIGESGKKPKEHCGVLAISTEKTTNVRAQLLTGLFHLQHRGQDGAGLAWYNGEKKKIQAEKTAGLIGNWKHKGNTLEKANLSTTASIGHVRYATKNLETVQFIQPFVGRGAKAALAFNGQIVTDENEGETLLHKLFYHLECGDLLKAVKMLQPVEGEAFSGVILLKETIFAFRDARGTRPLFIAKNESKDEKSVCVASETCAIDALGYTDIREVFPGEMIKIEKGVCIQTAREKNSCLKFCAFECFYFSREDSLYKNKEMLVWRQALGQVLSKKITAKGDLVIGIPQSGAAAGLGCSQGLKLPLSMGFTKNRYAGRSFVQKTQKKRLQTVAEKFQVQKSVFFKKRVILVDDTLVRGNTMKQLVVKAWQCGAKEVHVAIASPFVFGYCTMGVDMTLESQRQRPFSSKEDILKWLGATSIVFLEPMDIQKILGNELCFDCFQCKNKAVHK